jgi:hypothetical protein
VALIGIQIWNWFSEKKIKTHRYYDENLKLAHVLENNKNKNYQFGLDLRSNLPHLILSNNKR